MSAALIATSTTVTIGIFFSWVILLPGIATGLIMVAVVSGRGEKAEDEKRSGRWGPRANRGGE